MEDKCKLSDFAKLLDEKPILRNALLLYKALKNENVSEVSICLEGFEIFQTNYGYFCN